MVTWRAVHVKIPLLRYFSSCPSTNGNKTFGCEDTRNILALFRGEEGWCRELCQLRASSKPQTFLFLFWSWVDEMEWRWMDGDQSQLQHKKELIRDV